MVGTSGLENGLPYQKGISPQLPYDEYSISKWFCAMLDREASHPESRVGSLLEERTTGFISDDDIILVEERIDFARL